MTFTLSRAARDHANFERTGNDAESLQAAITGPAPHLYPHRVFIGRGSNPPILLVTRSGDLFVREHHRTDAIYADLGVATNTIIRGSMMTANAEALWREVHPTKLTRRTEIGRPYYRDSLPGGEYWSALRRIAVSMVETSWPDTSMKSRGQRIFARVCPLEAAREARFPPVAATLKSFYRGRWMTGATYRIVRRTCKEPAFTAAMREFKQTGNVGDLVDELNYQSRGQWLGGEMIREMTNHSIDWFECGHAADIADSVTTQDDRYTYCADCAERHFVMVDTCPRSDRGLYHEDDVYRWESDGEYHLEEEEEEPEDAYAGGSDEDDDCDGLLAGWSDSTGGLNHDTSFTPSHQGDFTMGVELEVEALMSRYDAVHSCQAHFNPKPSHPYAMFKKDGSLDDDDGFEIVTAARKLGDHIQKFKAWTPPDDLRSWGQEHCGMHVHIDSRAFTALTLGRFLQFYNDRANAALIKAIAGRHPDSDVNAAHFAACVDTPNGGFTPANVKKDAGHTRYKMVNLTNLSSPEGRRLKQNVQRNSKGHYSTVEVRIFRGTLKKERLLAQIEFAHATVVFCREAGNHELTSPAFLRWLATSAGKYKHLARWFGVYVPKATKLRPHPEQPAHTPLEFA